MRFWKMLRSSFRIVLEHLWLVESLLWLELLQLLSKHIAEVIYIIALFYIRSTQKYELTEYLCINDHHGY